MPPHAPPAPSCLNRRGICEAPFEKESASSASVAGPVTEDATSLRAPHRCPNARGTGGTRSPGPALPWSCSLQPPRPPRGSGSDRTDTPLPFFMNREGAGLESRDGTAQRSHPASCLQLGGGGHPASRKGREGAADLEHPLGSGLETVSGFFRSQGDSGEVTGTVVSLRGGGSDQHCHRQGIFLSCFCATCLLPHLAPGPVPPTHTLWPAEARGAAASPGEAGARGFWTRVHSCCWH